MSRAPTAWSMPTTSASALSRPMSRSSSAPWPPTAASTSRSCSRRASRWAAVPPLLSSPWASRPERTPAATAASRSAIPSSIGTVGAITTTNASPSPSVPPKPSTGPSSEARLATAVPPAAQASRRAISATSGSSAPSVARYQPHPAQRGVAGPVDEGVTQPAYDRVGRRRQPGATPPRRRGGRPPRARSPRVRSGPGGRSHYRPISASTCATSARTRNSWSSEVTAIADATCGPTPVR